MVGFDVNANILLAAVTRLVQINIRWGEAGFAFINWIVS